MLVLAHQNPATDEGGIIRVDRKFDAGMRYYCSQISGPVVSLHPRACSDHQFMDPIEMLHGDAPYSIVALDVDRHGLPSRTANAQLRRVIASSRLVYGQSLGAAKMAASLGVPYISIVEYTVGTQVTINTCDETNPLRKLVRGTKTVADYYYRQIPELAGAAAIHCNGYPIYDVLKERHRSCLLYLDSRVESAKVIGSDPLERRMTERHQRKLRLIYSGRFAKMKGVCDVVATGIALMNSNVTFELHLYGHGPERALVEATIRKHKADDFIRIHDAVSFHELFEISKTYDLFICCHIQSDPSCSYLEAHGAGLPIAGYGNQMWRRLQSVANTGVVSNVGDPDALARSLLEFVTSPDFDHCARRSRQFALRHSFEAEFERRVNDIKRHMHG